MNNSKTKKTYSYTYPTIHYRNLSPSQRRLLASILTTQSYSGFEGFMISKIRKILDDLEGVTYFQDGDNNLYIEKNLDNNQPSFLPLLVSHMDTVHYILEYDSKLAKKGKTIKDWKTGTQYGKTKYKVYRIPNPENKGYVYFSETGIGGDDKNGLFICLEMLRNRNIKHLKVLFTTEEETGQKGAEKAIKNHKDWFSNISYMLEPDRKGNVDIIYQWGAGSTFSDDFLNIVQPVWNKFKYSKSSGSVTDIFMLFEELDISCFNYSCGYYEPHSSNEYINENDLRRALDFTHALLKTIPLDKVYTHNYEPRTYNYNYGYNNYSSSFYKKKTKSQPMTTEIKEIEVRGPYNVPIIVKYNPISDHFFFLNGYNKINNSQIYTEAEKTFLKMQAISQDLDYFIEKGVISFLDYKQNMEELIDLWMDNMAYYEGLDGGLDNENHN